MQINYTVIIALLMIFAFTPALFLWILPRYKQKTHYSSFEECYAVFVSIIRSEIDMYETNVFENRKAITNSNYDNFYNDLSMRIIKRISPDLKRELCYYITEEAMISYVARTVQKYLAQYVKDPL